MQVALLSVVWPPDAVVSVARHPAQICMTMCLVSSSGSIAYVVLRSPSWLPGSRYSASQIAQVCAVTQVAPGSEVCLPVSTAPQPGDWHVRVWVVPSAVQSPQVWAANVLLTVWLQSSQTTVTRCCSPVALA